MKTLVKTLATFQHSDELKSGYFDYLELQHLVPEHPQRIEVRHHDGGGYTIIGCCLSTPRDHMLKKKDVEFEMSEYSLGARNMWVPTSKLKKLAVMNWTYVHVKMIDFGCSMLYFHEDDTDTVLFTRGFVVERSNVDLPREKINFI